GARTAARIPCVALYLISKLAPPAKIYTLSLHDALPISPKKFTSRSHITKAAPSRRLVLNKATNRTMAGTTAKMFSNTCASRKPRSEEHTSELQSRENLVCRLLLEKKNTITLVTALQRTG